MYGSYWHGLRRTCTKFVSFKVNLNVFPYSGSIVYIIFYEIPNYKEFLISYHEKHVTNLDRFVIYFCFVWHLFYM